MIKIIKHGTRKTCTCDNCGCVFSYEEEDIKVEDYVTHIVYGVEGHTWRGIINCPQCEHKIVLRQPKGV